MDLGTIEKKLQTRAYTNGADGFVRDVRLVWSNAIRRVPPHTATQPTETRRLPSRSTSHSP